MLIAIVSLFIGTFAHADTTTQNPVLEIMPVGQAIQSKQDAQHRLFLNCRDVECVDAQFVEESGQGERRYVGPVFHRDPNSSFEELFRERIKKLRSLALEKRAEKRVVPFGHSRAFFQPELKPYRVGTVVAGSLTALASVLALSSPDLASQYPSLLAKGAFVGATSVGVIVGIDLLMLFIQHVPADVYSAQDLALIRSLLNKNVFSDQARSVVVMSTQSDQENWELKSVHYPEKKIRKLIQFLDRLAVAQKLNPTSEN